MAMDAQTMKSMQSRVEDSWKILRLEESKSKIKELETEMTKPGFWDDQNSAKAVSQKVADLKSELEEWEVFKKDLVDAKEMFDLAQSENDVEAIEESKKQLQDIENQLRTMELATLFSGANEENNAIISIHAGAGGTDAMDWAGMLMRMFLRFIERKGWDAQILDESTGEEAGIKSITFSVKGRRAFGHLKSEAGVHRLVRISPFDAEKMRHTSFALVEVLPELSDLSEKELEINQKDLRIDTFMSSGKGGQGVNTTYSAVRITHIPTNIVVSCQNERSQSQNKDTAMKVLKSRLFQRMQEERAEKLEELKGGHKSPEWGNQIRSYVLHPYKMVKDHRTNAEIQDVEAVLDGDLDTLIESYLRKGVAELKSGGVAK